MVNEVLIFIIAFIFPHLYYRTLFFIFAGKIFDKPFLREKTGLKIHHIHYGMILMLFASLYLLFFDKNVYILILLGFGLGLMYDEFIPALYMKSNRKDELAAYKKSLKKTPLLFIIIILIIILFSFII